MQHWLNDSIFGPSALICPIGLLQTKVNKNISLIELLNLIIPKGFFSLHPGLMPIKVSKDTPIFSLFLELQHKDIKPLSLINLTEYQNNHRDLRSKNFTL